MKEILFIRKNIEKWQATERLATEADINTPDEVAAAYTDVTADLAFAYTHYPKSRITLYLNNLAAVLHNAIYRNKRERRSRLLTYWTREVPLTMWQERRMLWLSMLVFAVSMLIGVVSQLGDPEFCRTILGSGYVDMTIENIEKGAPMAVYGSGNEGVMFLGITLNNIGVAFRAFIMGLLTSIGTGLLLFFNGVMLGCFETFFAQHDLLWESILTVFLHGTLEISAIIVAGAAGLTLGSGMLFPGTYSRLTAFRRGAKRGLKIVVGTVPIFIVAGFIEGFITRHTELPDALRLTVVLASLAFVVFYYILLPRRVGRKAAAL